MNARWQWSPQERHDILRRGVAPAHPISEPRARSFFSLMILPPFNRRRDSRRSGLFSDLALYSNRRGIF